MGTITGTGCIVSVYIKNRRYVNHCVYLKGIVFYDKRLLFFSRTKNTQKYQNLIEFYVNISLDIISAEERFLRPIVNSKNYPKIPQNYSEHTLTIICKWYFSVCFFNPIRRHVYQEANGFDSTTW